MLFNLTSGRHFPSKQKSGKHIRCSSYYGPFFTGDYTNSELGAWAEPFNGDGHCASSAFKSGYEITVDEAGFNMLTNKKDGDFTIAELEVW